MLRMAAALRSAYIDLKRWDTMGFFSNLFGRSDDYDYEMEDEESFEAGELPPLHNGVTLTVETPEGEVLFDGRITNYDYGDTDLTLERVPGALSFKVRELGTIVFFRGHDEAMKQYMLKGTISESTRLICRVKNLQVKPIPEARDNFRLRVNCPATIYLPSDRSCSNPEECILVDISAGGACLESFYLHAEDEVLKLKIKLEDYAPMEFLGEVIRAVEFEPNHFRYGFLFAQLEEPELTELTRTLYNLQVGNKVPWTRHGPGGPGHW